MQRWIVFSEFFTTVMIDNLGKENFFSLVKLFKVDFIVALLSRKGVGIF